MVSIVNFVKIKPQKVACLQFYVKKWGQITQIGASYRNLLVITNKVLARVHALRNELMVFLTNEQRDEAKLVAYDDWWERVAYMADIFQYLNELNTRMEGRNENLLTSTDKINGFRSKVQLGQQHVNNKNLEMFPLSKKCEHCFSKRNHTKTFKHS